MAKEEKKKKVSGIKIVGTIFLMLIAIVVGGAFGYFNYLISLTNNSTKEQFNQENIIQNKEVQNKDEYWTFAIFGVDARNSTLGEGNRSDSVIVASLNLGTNEVKLTSMYRDTLVEIPGYGYDKLTHAYAFGGPELAISTLNHNFDLDIKDYVTVNFAIAEDIIDLLGGVEIDVQSSEVKWLNGYVRSLAKEGADTNVKYIDAPGLQTLSGSQAVAYARIRYTNGGDYKRAKRQRTVLNAALAKAKTCGIGTLNDVIQTAFSDISTNLTVTDILKLAANIANYEIKDSQGFPYHIKEARAYTYAFQDRTVAVDIPTMLAEDLKTLHYELYGEGSPSTIEAPSDSHLEEDNGVANGNNGYNAGTTSQAGEESTEAESSETTTEESADTTEQQEEKEYTPSENAQRISQYLAEQAS